MNPIFTAHGEGLDWEPNRIAFWDNRSTQHEAVSDYGPAKRLMERLTIIGDRPM
jgi:taurine dioxygenase